jgi:hypothetical protein
MGQRHHFRAIRRMPLGEPIVFSAIVVLAITDISRRISSPISKNELARSADRGAAYAQFRRAAALGAMAETG